MVGRPVRILEERRGRDVIISEFGITEARENEAAILLLKYLRRGAEVSLRNDLDEGLEGTTSFAYALFGYRMMEGGHDWQSSWKRCTREDFRKAVVDLAHLNRGQHWSDRGSIIRRRWTLLAAIWPLELLLPGSSHETSPQS